MKTVGSSREKLAMGASARVACRVVESCMSSRAEKCTIRSPSAKKGAQGGECVHEDSRTRSQGVVRRGAKRRTHLVARLQHCAQRFACTTGNAAGVAVAIRACDCHTLLLATRRRLAAIVRAGYPHLRLVLVQHLVDDLVVIVIVDATALANHRRARLFDLPFVRGLHGLRCTAIANALASACSCPSLRGRLLACMASLVDVSLPPLPAYTRHTEARQADRRHVTFV